MKKSAILLLISLLFFSYGETGAVEVKGENFFSDPFSNPDKVTSLGGGYTKDV